MSDTKRNTNLMVLDAITSASTRKGDPLERPNVPYIGLEHIERDLGIINGQGIAADVRSTKTLFEVGDLLYGKLRPYLNKVWVAQFDGMCSTDILVYPKNNSVESAFLKYRFMTRDFVIYACENSNGVNLPRVSANALARFPIMLPPLSDQRRIVAEIEKQFTRLEAGVAALKRVQANLKRYRAAVLKAACEGRLVETEAELARKEDRPYETGAALITRILSERRRNWQGRGKYKEPVAPEADGLSAVPEGWAWASGEQLFSWSSGEGLTQKEIKEGKFPVFGGNGITGHHDAFIADSPTMIIGRVGALCGNVYLSDGPAWITDNAIYATKTPSCVSLRFIQMVFTKAELNKRAAGSGQPFVNQRMLNETALAIPPVVEQTRIVAEVERRLSVIEGMEAVVAANLKRAARLRQSILQKAFGGEI